MNISTQEKRRFIRFRLLAFGQVVIESGEIFEGTISDISKGGAFLDVRGFPYDSLNQEVVVNIKVSIDTVNHIIDAHAKVVRITQEGIGLFFSSMDQGSMTVFNNILQSIQEKIGAM